MHAWVETLYGGFWHAWDPDRTTGPLRGLKFGLCGLRARLSRCGSPLSGSYQGHAASRALKVLCRTEIVHEEPGPASLPAWPLGIDDPCPELLTRSSWISKMSLVWKKGTKRCLH